MTLVEQVMKPINVEIAMGHGIGVSPVTGATEVNLSSLTLDGTQKVRHRFAG